MKKAAKEKVENMFKAADAEVAKRILEMDENIKNSNKDIEMKSAEIETKK